MTQSNKTSEYKILTASTPQILMKSVNSLITAGYIPLGGVSCVSKSRASVFEDVETLFAQAVIRPPAQTGEQPCPDQP